ncbi:MAG TPA: hypothetical protein VEC01_18970 [Noviherbaspirillum sp.]|uniref:hypothetical protein n=1 Tax=Noviherbaspirillum sp. TaxID=1926288 RepID=UPI002D522F5D|nr:hypothetical protein [Noviherbaspirillum sp.]HYD97412.1 hypothetical protein [Noviherbaspirillum sp.]
MTIRREDLVAAAAAGLLQYRQIDPLLVFLLQRDIRAQRQALVAQTQANAYSRLNAALSYAAAFLAVVTASLFGVLFASRFMDAAGNAALVLFAAGYIVVGLGLAAWFRRRGFGGRLRVLSAVIMASLPLAVVALQQVSA